MKRFEHSLDIFEKKNQNQSKKSQIGRKTLNIEDQRDLKYDDASKAIMTNKEQESNLKIELEQVKRDQAEADKKLLDLIEEETRLSQNFEKISTAPSDEEIHHYKYILPLVKEIHLLELKVKEKQEDYDELQLQNEILRQQSHLLADCLAEKDSLLKRWSQCLQGWNEEDEDTKASSKPTKVTNVDYTASHSGAAGLQETLHFTVLCHMVQVRVKVKVTSLWPSLLYGQPQPVAVGAKSDTFIPGLSQQVVLCFQEERPVEDLITFLETFLTEEVAPFAIICPVKKTKKKLKNKEK